jgi:ABC-type antimicrobial peptide transport system permease subunit
VGVVQTGKYGELKEEPRPYLYRELKAPGRVYLIVRREENARSLPQEMRRMIHSVDANLVPMETETMTEYMAFPLFGPHVASILLTVFGAVALVLATLGMYGVLSYSVSQRTGEIGIRMALGADQGRVLRLILRQGMFLAGLGIIFGIGISFAATRVLTSLLYGIKPNDPATFAAVSAFLAAIAFAASYLPARRAVSIDPARALREE